MQMEDVLTLLGLAGAFTGWSTTEQNQHTRNNHRAENNTH